MSTFDPMATAVDWLDAYRAASYSIVNMYSKTASLECECGGPKTLVGHTAIAHYWRERFEEKPAGELIDLRPDGDGVVLSYRVPDGVVQAFLRFDKSGKIEQSRCGPTNGGLA
jgi:hypothetical protein